MLNPQQKQIITACIILVIILGLITACSRPNFKFSTKPISSNSTGLTPEQSKAYEDYLSTIKTDPKASQELFQTILTKDDVEKEVTNSLRPDLPKQIPTIDVAKIKVSKSANAEVASQYLSQTLGKVYSFNNSTKISNQNLFEASYQERQQLLSDISTLTKQIYAIEVPADAINLQISLLTALASYENLVNVAGSYNAQDYSSNEQIWPKVYNTYSIVSEQNDIYSQELTKLANKYKISQIESQSSYADYQPGESKDENNFSLIPKAHAFLGIGDLTFSTTIGDIPRIIMDAIQAGIESAVLQFLSSMLAKLIEKIEKNYLIANFLYYSDALVNAQYAQDYMSKYVADVVDQNVIKQLIPQFACGRQPYNLRPLLEARATQHLGFNPATLSLEDPNYYSKLASVGDFLSSPEGWDVYYQDLADMTVGASQQAINRELTSAGLKTPRDANKLSISQSISNIVSAQRAGFNALLMSSISSAKNLIAKVVATLTETLINKFVFAGVSGSGGNIGVLKEQPMCLDTFQITPVVAMEPTNYVPPPPPPTTEDAAGIQCSYQASLTNSCTEAVLSYLQKCASSGDSSTCSAVKGSAYVDAILKTCPANVQPPKVESNFCIQFKNLIGFIN